MRVLLTGATGVAGLGALRVLLQDESFTHVTTLTRRRLPSWIELPGGTKASSPDSSPTHPRLTTLTQPTFAEYSSDIRSVLPGQDACIWALGSSSSGKSEEEYTELIIGYLKTVLDALKEAGVGTEEKPFRFVFVSGDGADSSEKSMILFARVKGKAENMLLKFAEESGGHFKPFILRPAYFFPSRKYPQDELHQRGGEDLGRFAAEAAKGTWDGKGPIFENQEMKRLLREMKF
ncbi:hypothetical protein EVG20_g8727 [Dentipellis fragilis]|uniref:NAD(P)-binding domain-containing protein n=1 Tax=Dentipellis fragilis TaxID=205917 RepID=A0A4Y9Y3K9_9AGAM|nr:hypothetical protein EVG20_g8727 [Dentipellis fragilis]